MAKLNLYLISQDVNNNYDTYSAAVVVAPDEDTARNIHPGGEDMANAGHKFSSWCLAEDVDVELIGEAAEDIDQGVVCVSFHAG